MERVHYVIIRRDLPLGVLAAMVGHAVGVSVDRPHEPGMTMVVLEARDEGHLKSIGERLDRRGVGLVRFVESDPPYVGQLMSIGMRPGRKEIVGRYLRDLPKLRSPPG